VTRRTSHENPCGSGDSGPPDVRWHLRSTPRPYPRRRPRGGASAGRSAVRWDPVGVGGADLDLEPTLVAHCVAGGLPACPDRAAAGQRVRARAVLRRAGTPLAAGRDLGGPPASWWGEGRDSGRDRSAARREELPKARGGRRGPLACAFAGQAAASSSRPRTTP